MKMVKLVRSLCVFFCYAAFSNYVSAETPANMSLHLFNESQVSYHGSRCLDGSPSGYYYRAGQNTTSWIIYLEGGGYCHTEDSCKNRSQRSLGSSKHWPGLTTGSSLVSPDAEINKDFYTWNHVFIPYCSGDMHSGQHRSPNEWGLYFAGHLTIETVVSDLLNKTNFANATRLILSGSSAGGIGAFEHADYFSETVHWAEVKSVPIGGYFFPLNVTEYYLWLQNKTEPPKNRSLYDLYQSFTNINCATQNKERPQFCGPANIGFLYPYIKTPLYVAENQYDSNQIFEQMGCPYKLDADVIRYVEYYGVLMRKALRGVMVSPKKDGLFGPSCLDHTEDLIAVYDSPTINGVSFGQSLGDWYFSEKANDKQLMDDCGELPCNHSHGCKTS